MKFAPRYTDRMTDDLIASHRLFEDAAYRLTGTRTKLIVDDLGNRVVATASSLYAEMEENIAGQQGTSFGGVARSMPPCWLDGVDWMMRVDRTVAGWVYDLEGNTFDKLTFLLAWTFTPEESTKLAGWGADLLGFVESAEALLDARRSFGVSAPCPECHTPEVARPDERGDMVRRPALQVSSRGAKCLSCGARWDAENLLVLAREIACAHLDGIDYSALSLIGTSRHELDGLDNRLSAL